jgi:hypothetical protein
VNPNQNCTQAEIEALITKVAKIALPTEAAA